MSLLSSVRNVSSALAAVARGESPFDTRYPSRTVLRYGGTGRNWQIEVGDLHANGVVATVMSTILDKIAIGVVSAGRRDKSGVWVEEKKETLDFERAIFGPVFGRNTFVVLAASLKFYGMAYLYKVRDDAGRVVNYTPFMHTQVNQDPIRGVMRWKITKHGGGTSHFYAYEEDLIVIGYGIPDPRNPMLSISPLACSLREVATENECTNFVASVMANMGWAGAILSPETPIAEKLQKGWVERVKEAMKTFTRDRRGENFVAPEPMKVTQVGFHASAMQVIDFAKLSLTKICAALNVDPMAAGLPSENKTYSNLGESRKGLIDDCILPIWRVMLSAIAPHLRKDLVWLGATAGIELAILDSCYPERGEDRFKVSQDLRDDWKSGVITREEIRKAKGYPTTAADKVFYTDVMAALKATGARGSRYSASERAKLEKLHETSSA